MKNFLALSQEFKSFLESQTWIEEPKGLYEPIEYILKIGGKRVRPSLCLASAQMFSGNSEIALNQALVVEVFHNFTLMHDDIMDDAPLRRGQTTVHEKWDANTGILSGDAMMILSYQILPIKAEVHALELLNTFSQTAIDVCRGQQMDIDFESEVEVSLDQYLEMIRLKTAVLLSGSLDLGAIVAEADLSDRKLIRDFGEKLGLVFQIQDDILDAYGDAELFGKKEGGDIDANKKTILFALALQHSNESQKKELLELYSSPAGTAGKIERVLEIYNSLHLRHKAEQMMQEYHQKALQDLQGILVNAEAKAPLFELAVLLMERTV